MLYEGATGAVPGRAGRSSAGDGTFRRIFPRLREHAVSIRWEDRRGGRGSPPSAAPPRCMDRPSPLFPPLWQREGRIRVRIRRSDGMALGDAEVARGLVERARRKAWMVPIACEQIQRVNCRGPNARLASEGNGAVVQDPGEEALVRNSQRFSLSSSLDRCSHPL